MDLEYPNGATPLDPDEIAGLRLTHITTRVELDRWEQANIIEALGWLEKSRPQDVLDEPFVRELHRRMFGDVWEWAGKYRNTDKNIGVPWQQVPTAVRNLIDDSRLWVEQRTETADEIAVRFHHRLVSVHPFSNGNGGHARLITDLLLEVSLGERRFSWGGRVEISKVGETRLAYVAALQVADRGDHGPLLEFARSGVE